MFLSRGHNFAAVFLMHILCARCLLVSKRIYFMLVLVENVWSISEFFLSNVSGHGRHFLCLFGLLPDSEGWCSSQCHTLIVLARLCHLLLTSRSVTTHPLYRFFVTGIITCHIGTLGNCSDIWCASRLPFIAQSHFLLNFLATFALFLPLPLSRVSVWASSICLTYTVCSASKF